MRGGMNHSFPIEVNGKVIGRVVRRDDGLWVPRDINRMRHGSYATPAEAREALIEAVERWEAEDINAGRTGRSYGHSTRR